MLKLDRVGLAGVLVRIEGNRLSGILLADTEEILTIIRILRSFLIQDGDANSGAGQGLRER